MKIFLALALIQSCCEDGEPAPWEGYAHGVKWERSLAAAQEAARAQDRPILLFVLAGDLDKGGC